MTAPWKERREIGDAVLYLGDCLAVMPALAKVDHVITDPPYSERTHTGHDASSSGHICTGVPQSPMPSRPSPAPATSPVGSVGGGRRRLSMEPSMRASERIAARLGRLAE